MSRPPGIHSILCTGDRDERDIPLWLEPPSSPLALAVVLGVVRSGMAQKRLKLNACTGRYRCTATWPILDSAELGLHFSCYLGRPGP